jgi:hypothetical protein
MRADVVCDPLGAATVVDSRHRVRYGRFLAPHVPYSQQVKPRFTTWFLAALLAIAMPFGVPVSRVGTPSYGIVRIDPARRPEPGRIVERRERTPLIQARTSPGIPASGIPAHDLHWPIPILNQPLFQRPPPEALLSRA